VTAVFDSDARNQELAVTGYTVIPLLDAAEIREVQALHDAVFPTVPLDFYSSIVSASAEQRIRVRDALRAIVVPKLLKLMPRHRIRLASFMTKRPTSRRGSLPLHRDAWITDHRVQVGPSIWCPLVDVGPANACLRMVPGSQHLIATPCPMNALLLPRPFLTYQWDADPVDAEFVRDLPLRAGMAVAYDPRVLHCSGENVSGEPRVAFSCLTVPDGLEPSVYWWDDRPPGRMQVFEVEESHLCEMEYATVPEEPYPAGVRLLDSFDVPREPIRIDRDALRRLQAGGAG
jgi:hypothetical protein